MRQTLQKDQFRHEYKFFCNATQNALLKIRVQGIMKRDNHTIGEGYYQIRSLYFDTREDQFYYENESGIGDRDKYRIRIYNADCSKIVLEKKSKRRQMTRKLSCDISEEICQKLMHGESVIIQDSMTEMQKELLGELQIKGLHPVVIVEYRRYPFVEKNGNVRVTFDEDICSSNDISNFLEKEIIKRPILEKGRSILEVKWDAFLPSYIKDHIQLESLQWSNFSKYYLCRKYNTYGGIRV